MKIAVTGASGFVGRHLTPRLAGEGIELVLFGRSPERLKAQYPGAACFGYEELAQMRGCTAVVHLAVMNNDKSGTPSEFHFANVELLKRVIEAAGELGVKRIINLSTSHVFAPEVSSEYARSKRDAMKYLESCHRISVTNIVCPKIYSIVRDDTGGVAKSLLMLKWKILSALKPAVDVSRLVDKIMESCAGSRGGTLICADDQDENPFYRFGKRFIDLSFAISAIVFLGWAFALIWLAVRMTSSGPGIFAQTRVGEGGRAFTCYKFRTMYQGTRQAGTHEVSRNSVTPIGSWLRKSKLDELPQVWNVLRGEISLIGPRPCLPMQSELIEERMRRQVYAVKPGITGLAQINNIDMSHPVRLAEWDARYVILRSLVNDVRIFLWTISGQGKGDRTAVS